VTIYTQRDANPAALAGARIAMLGYGSQGRAHALNLRDSGFDVVVGARVGGISERKAEADGFTVLSPSKAVAQADLVALLAPDLAHGEIYQQHIAPFLKRGSVLLVAHGFSVHFREIDPRHDIDVVLVAPRGPGELVRSEFVQGRSGPCLFAVRQDATGSARARALAYALGIGGIAGGAVETSFAEQTETDLFGEQALRLGADGSNAFDILVEAGYQPEVAAFACFPRDVDATDRPTGPGRTEDEIRSVLVDMLIAIQGMKFARDWTSRLTDQPVTRAA
jgi:ketol-acid reductoisomerase